MGSELRGCTIPSLDKAVSKQSVKLYSSKFILRAYYIALAILLILISA